MGADNTVGGEPPPRASGVPAGGSAPSYPAEVLREAVWIAGIGGFGWLVATRSRRRLGVDH
jgi:hypothetical protein